MAGGVGSTKQGGKFDRASTCQYRYHLGRCNSSKSLKNNTFQRRQKLESDRIYSQSINILQENIFRLLYSNLDLSQEEQVLVKIISSVPYIFNSAKDFYIDDIFHIEERLCKKESYNYKSLFEDTVSQNVVDTSISSSSDMADSGLETGSVSPQELTTVLESSSIDLEESQATDYKDSNKLSATKRIPHPEEICDEDDPQEGRPKLQKLKGYLESTSDYNSSDMNADVTCSSSETEQPHLDSSSSYDENAQRARAREREEISRYEDQVLNDPFYESDSSSESEHPSPFIQTESFEFVEPVSNEGRSSEVSNSLPERNTKPTSSYFFIDASTLNDDEVVTTKESFVENQHSMKFAIQENIVQFQQNLKLTEHLEPLTEPRKVKRVSTEDKTATEKEALVVEIKETDSGESTQLSPCPDNAKLDVVDNDDALKRIAKEEDRPSLVRENTFELDANEREKISMLRQEYERRQGSLVFKSSIPQYSGHRVDGDSCYLSLDKYDYDTVEKEAESRVARVEQPSNLAQLMTKSASDEHIGQCERKDEEYSMSLPVTLNHDLELESQKKFKKRWEAIPIVSGGVTSLNFSESKVKETSSPLVRRKTESTPIVSGGAVMMIYEEKPKAKPIRMTSSMTAWVVDMSDCNKVSSSKTQSNGNMSHSFSSSECVKKVAKKPKAQGFFVSLNNIDGTPKQKPKDQIAKEQKLKEQKPEQNETKSSQYCEFFIDMSKKLEKKRPKRPERTSSDDKKNIFSMFIDLSDSPKSTDKSTKSEESSVTEECSEREQNQKKSGVFMFIESDSPVVRRRTLSSSRPPFKRHSWNIDKTNPPSNGVGTSLGKELLFRKEHKRAHSLSVDRGELRKFQGKPSSSSHSLSESARPEFDKSTIFPRELRTRDESVPNMDTSVEDVFEFEVRDTPPNSHIEIIDEDLRVGVKRHEYHELVTTLQSDSQCSEQTATASTEGGTNRKSETFDISSGSGPSSDNNDFELGEILNGDTSKFADRSQLGPLVSGRILETRKSLDEKIKKIECELKDPEFRKSNEKDEDSGGEKGNNQASFVRLSDLDKTPSQTSSTIEEDKVPLRMSSSIPETSWIESKLVMGRSNGPTRTLARKFPSNMSTSLPAKQKSPMEDLVMDGDTEVAVSESELSSMQSSMGRSGAEGSTEETETSSFAGAKPYNRLGEDLLRMFLEEINPDVTIDVGGRRIRAHKCILSSRCQYFAAILSGGWIESAGNVISLQGYSYNAVHFALCHIYSGESNIPDSISIVELATLADMLCLEGLKEVIGYTLKVKYCHLFHKPCQICAVGVLECMPLAAAYGLDEVYRKSLRWITRHFVRVWPCKAFATLPRELMDKCYHQHIVHMSTDNVLQTMMDCDKLLAILPNVRWAEPIFRLVSNLLEAAMKFLSDNFSSVLGSDSFQNLGRELTWNISRLEDNFLAAAERLPPDQACKSYAKLHKMIASAQPDEPEVRAKWGPLFLDFLRKIQNRVEKCLVRDATRAARTTTWLKMDLELRRRIQELACLVILPHETTKRPSRRGNFIKEPRIPQKSSTVNRNLDLRRVKMAISEHNDKTQKQITTVTTAMATTTTTITTTTTVGTTSVQQHKRILIKPKTDPLERKMQDDKSGNDSSTRPKSWPNKIEVKSRYLEPRHKSVPKENASQPNHDKVLVQQRRKIMISSSDSSRTSSPAMKRASERKSVAKMKLPIQKTVKALSSDSLTGANASKINNTKKESNTVSKSCGITRPESPSLKVKEIDIGLSVDSLAESHRQKVPTRKTSNKMDTSMSTDSLATEVVATPRSVSSKISPILNRTTTRAPPMLSNVKKSPPTQQRSPLSAPRRPQRSLESSTAASRSRAAAINAYHGTPNLRKNLLDAAKTPDVGTVRQQQNQTRIVSQQITKRDKKETLSNQSSQDSPSKRSPKLNSTVRTVRSSLVKPKKTEDKTKPKQNGELPKHLTVGSRSGTFLKDEPTILKKVDIKTAQIDT